MTSKLIVPVAFPEGCNMTLVGLEIPEGLRLDEWQGIGELLEQARRRKEMELQALLWAIGDWLAYGEFQFGEKYLQSIQEFGRAEQTLMNLNWVASKTKPDRRRPSLTIAHHAAVAALPPPEADELLDMAEMENVTSGELRKVVQNRKLREAGKDPDIEHAKIALDTAMEKLSHVPRQIRAQMIVERLIVPLADIDTKRPLFLEEIGYGCAELQGGCRADTTDQ